jgi:KaiC/GvpD/RAD55 family RecA-like ATPase
METTDTINPIAAIMAEVEKAQRVLDKIGIMAVKSANQWVDDALEEPDPKLYFYDLLVEGECTVLFASSNAGKSILATQMAEAVARENTVLYLDCELSAKQFQMRYVEDKGRLIHRFPSTLLRAEIRPEDIIDTNLEEAILDSVAVAAERRGIHHIFVDNITFLLNDSEKGEAAGAFMKKLLALKKKYCLTMVIVGHSPKRLSRTPMTQNDLAGSAKRMNFFDADIAIGRSAKDSVLRYVKQVKVRTGVNQYDGEKVLLFRLKQDQGYTQFVYEDTVNEADHLRPKNALTEAEDMQELINLQAQNKTVRQIADETGFAPTTVHRKLRKAVELGYKPTPCSVPFHTGVEQTEQLFK